MVAPPDSQTCLANRSHKHVLVQCWYRGSDHEIVGYVTSSSSKSSAAGGT
jgi:hypothetical protein